MTDDRMIDLAKRLHDQATTVSIEALANSAETEFEYLVEKFRVVTPAQRLLLARAATYELKDWSNHDRTASRNSSQQQR